MFPLPLDTVLTLVKDSDQIKSRAPARGFAARPGRAGTAAAHGGRGPTARSAREVRGRTRSRAEPGRRGCPRPARCSAGSRWSGGRARAGAAERAGRPDPAGARLRRAEPGRRLGGRPPSLRRRLARAVAPGDVRGAARPAGPGTARGERQTVTRREDTGEGSAVQPRPGLGGWSASGALRSEAARAPAPGSCRGLRTGGVEEGRRPVGRAGAGACFPGDPTVSPQLHPLWLATRLQGLKILPEAPEQNQIALSRAQGIGDSALAPGHAGLAASGLPPRSRQVGAAGKGSRHWSFEVAPLPRSSYLLPTQGIPSISHCWLPRGSSKCCVSRG